MIMSAELDQPHWYKYALQQTSTVLWTSKEFWAFQVRHLSSSVLRITGRQRRRLLTRVQLFLYDGRPWLINPYFERTDNKCNPLHTFSLHAFFTTAQASVTSSVLHTSNFTAINPTISLYIALVWTEEQFSKCTVPCTMVNRPSIFL
jgi:hypothetical protein